MRQVLAALLVCAIVLPSVSAVSVLLPSKIQSGSFSLDYSQLSTLNFRVRGDGAQKNVTFFFSPLDDCLVFSNNNDFQVSYIIDNYEELLFDVEVLGASECSAVEVKYGVISHPTTGAGMAFEEVTGSSFLVDVLCGSGSCVPLNNESNSTNGSTNGFSVNSSNSSSNFSASSGFDVIVEMTDEGDDDSSSSSDSSKKSSSSGYIPIPARVSVPINNGSVNNVLTEQDIIGGSTGDSAAVVDVTGGESALSGMIADTSGDGRPSLAVAGDVLPLPSSGALGSNQRTIGVVLMGLFAALFIIELSILVGLKGGIAS